MGDEHGTRVHMPRYLCEEPSGAAGSPCLRPAAPCRRRETTTAPGRSRYEVLVSRFLRAGGGEAQGARLLDELRGAAVIASDARAFFVGDSEVAAALGVSGLAGLVEEGSGLRR